MFKSRSFNPLHRLSIIQLGRSVGAKVSDKKHFFMAPSPAFEETKPLLGLVERFKGAAGKYVGSSTVSFPIKVTLGLK